MKHDAAVQRRVLEELDWEPSVEAARIGVSVEDGVVTLTGHVPVLAEKAIAEKATKRVRGVVAVANDIEVSLSPQHQRDDTDIASAAVHALQWNAKVPHERIQVTVRNGWISLEGTVDHKYQKDAAADSVRHLIGVLGVTNSIRIEPTEEHRVTFREQSGAIRERVEVAMRRSAALTAKNVEVELKGHTVLLSGDVRTHAEREEAERIAWTTPGVTQVDNMITITPWGSGPADEWGF